MMPSTFRWKHCRAIHTEREIEIMKYAPLVMKVVNKFNREESRVGVFDKHDIIQSGFVGLVEAYDRIKKSEGKLNVNYLELNIKGTIDRYLNYQATGVAIPEYQLQKQKAEIIADRVFGAWMYGFRLDEKSTSGVAYSEFSERIAHETSHYNDELNQDLSDLLWELTSREREIINMSYGVNAQKQSMKQMEKHYNLTRQQISRIKNGALKRLNTLKNAMLMQKYL